MGDGQVPCRHCGTPFTPKGDRQEFCCGGCEYVYRMLNERGFDTFYQLREGVLPPAGQGVFEKGRDERLARIQEQVEKSGREQGGERDVVGGEFEVQGISCVGCVWLVERLLGELPGVLEVRVRATVGRLMLRWRRGEFDLSRAAEELRRFGYRLGPVKKGDGERESGRLARRVGLSAALAMNAMIFTLPHYLGIDPGESLARLCEAIVFCVATVSVGSGGSYFFVRSWEGLRRGVLHMDFPISLGVGLAYAGSVVAWIYGDRSFLYFDFVAVFTFLMLGGRWLQQRAVEANQVRLLQSGADVGEVEVLRSDCMEEDAEGIGRVDAEELQPGVRYRVKSGGMVPVRSRLISQKGLFGLEWISGEAEACARHGGAVLPAGARNIGQKAVVVDSLEGWSGSLLAMLLKVEPEGAYRQRGTERVIWWYLVAVLSTAVVGGVFWWGMGWGVVKAFSVMVAVLVVSCPCALGVALPMVNELAVEGLRRAGVFVRDGALWERLWEVRYVVFDKTGTVTLDSLALEDSQEVLGKVEMFEGDAAGILLGMVDASLHPVSLCLREALMARGGVDPVKELKVEEVIGFGLEACVKGEVWRLGRVSWALGGEEKDAVKEADCVFSRDGKEVAHFCFTEAVREEASEQCRALAEQGMEVYLLSGDRKGKVEEMGRRLGIGLGRCVGEVSPEGKAEWVRRLAREGGVMMVGDGANDSLAFNEAVCRGTPAITRGLLEQKADFYWLGKSMAGIGGLFRMAECRRRAVRRVMVVNTIYNVAVVAVALAGGMSPLLAAVLMPLSSMVSMGLAALPTIPPLILRKGDSLINKGRFRETSA